MPATPALHGDRPGRFLVIVAHPDDADFGPAATAARWIDEGSVGELVCCTSGDAGADDADTDPLELARVREEEQRAAASVVGYRDVHFLHQPDGALDNDLPLREQLVRIIREIRPDAVLTPDPTTLFTRDGHVQHTDHRAAGLAAVDAVYPAARNAMAFPHLAKGGLEPHVVRWLYLFWTNQPDAWVDVSGYVDRKMAALRCHVSQIRDPEGFEQHVRERIAAAGTEAGVEAADPFRVIELQ